MEVKIAVIKEWNEGFKPSNKNQERLKSRVEEALKEVDQDFKVKKFPREIPIK